MTPEKKLEKEIKEKQAALEAIKNNKAKKDSVIRPLESYSDKEKIEAFDSFYTGAISTIKQKEGEENHDDDAEYTWESVMELLAYPKKSKEFWEYFNKL